VVRGLRPTSTAPCPADMDIITNRSRYS